MDILQSKLSNGVRVNKYVKSYGERPNDYESVSKCGFSFSSIFVILIHPSVFRNKFAAIYREYTPKEAKKMFYVHMTSVTQTKAMRNVLSSGEYAVL